MKILIFLFLLSFSVFAQNDYIKILSARKSSVLVGQKITSGFITVSVSGYVAILSSNGSTKELKIPGKYNITSIIEELKKKTSLSSRYSEYVITQLTLVDPIDIHSNYQKNMKVTGAVDRAVNDEKIKFEIPNGSQFKCLYGATLKWNHFANYYTFTGTNLFEDVKIKNVITTDSFNLDTCKENLLVVVYSELGCSKKILIKKATPIEKMYFDSFPRESALECFMLARDLDDNDFFFDSQNMFLLSIKKEPESIEYKNEYQLFLIKHKM